MLIKNPQKEAHPSTLTPDAFARAMQRLDLSSVPPENRGSAIREHMTRIMAGSIIDPTVRFNLAASAIQRFRRR